MIGDRWPAPQLGPSRAGSRADPLSGPQPVVSLSNYWGAPESWTSCAVAPIGDAIPTDRVLANLVRGPKIKSQLKLLGPPGDAAATLERPKERKMTYAFFRRL
jgi:hypothetical protein